MSNTIINPTVVAKEALMQLENNCVMAKLVHRSYEPEYQKLHNGWKPGSAITIKAPMYARVKDGMTIDVVDILEQSTTLTVNYWKHVAYKVTGSELTLNIETLSRSFIEPAMVALGNYIDTTIMDVMKNWTCNQVGTPGSTPGTYLPYALANATLMNHAVPVDGNISCVVNPMAQAYLCDHLKNLLNPGINGPAVERAKFGNIANMDMYVSQNTPTHTCGTAAGLVTPLMYGTTAENAVALAIDTNGSWTLTLTEGDIFTVANVYGVNPISGVSTGQLRQFVCRSHTDNGTDATISCIPGVAPWNIRSAAATETYLPYQNISALPADNALVSVAGTASLAHAVNLAFHRDAFALVMVPIEVPESCGWKATMSKNGYSVTVTRDFDIVNYAEYLRFDVLFGVKMLNPFMAVRIAG